MPEFRDWFTFLMTCLALVSVMSTLLLYFNRPVCQEIPECPDCVCDVGCPECPDCPDCEKCDVFPPNYVCDCVTQAEREENPDGTLLQEGEDSESCYPLLCPDKYDYCSVFVKYGGGGNWITLRSGEERYFGDPQYISECEVVGKWFEK